MTAARLVPWFFALSLVLLVPLTACDRAGDAVVYPRSTDSTGCVIEQITNEPYDEYQFNGVSFDGQRLAYAFNRGDDQGGNPVSGAFLLDLRTGDKTKLLDPMKNAGSFSRDGRFLVGAQEVEGGRTDLYELDLETGEARAVAPHEQWDYLPTYASNDQHILFNSYREGEQADIYLYERSSETLERLTTYGGYDAHAQFSPDGTQILFHRMNGVREAGGYDFDLITLDLATQQERRLTSGPFEESYGSWAPDSRHIVFSSDFEEAPEKHNLYILSPEGEVITQLTDGASKDSYAYWIPDGTYIYFNSDRTGPTNIYRMPMNGLACIPGAP